MANALAINHPYYANEGCYWAPHHEAISEHETWAEYLAENAGYSTPGVNGTMDMNLIIRWDWKVPTEEDMRYAQEYDEDPPTQTLQLTVHGQRKGILRTVLIHNMRDDQEPEVRAFLEAHWLRIQQNWSPISGVPVPPEDNL